MANNALFNDRKWGQHGLENLRNGSNHWVMCYIIIVKAVAPLLPLFSEVVCVWTLKLNALHQYWLGLQSFDEGACLLLTLCFACGKHLYMWKCSVLMQSQACPWVFCMFDFYDGVKQKLSIMHQTGTEKQLAGGSEWILMMWLVFV